jgi:hypothetical protein
MRYRKLDADGDYSFGNQQGDFYIDSAEGVAQSVKTRLSLFTGEWFLDTSDGTPWRTEVLGKYTKDAYDAVIKDRVLSTPGVTLIASYISSFDADARTLTVRLTIATQYGETSFATTL